MTAKQIEIRGVRRDGERNLVDAEEVELDPSGEVTRVIARVTFEVSDEFAGNTDLALRKGGRMSGTIDDASFLAREPVNDPA